MPKREVTYALDELCKNLERFTRARSRGLSASGSVEGRKIVQRDLQGYSLVAESVSGDNSTEDNAEEN